MIPNGPLSGFRILEMGANLTGPFATMLLGDQGADVIKLETATGDQMRYAGDSREGVNAMGTMFLSLNRSKRSIVIDLKTAEGVAQAQTLAATCDAVVQNFRPGVVERLGLGYDEVKALRSDIIYVSIDGVGDIGPDRDRRVYDIVVQGMSGFAGVQADRDTGEPRTIQNAVVDKTTGLVVAQAVTAALLQRSRTGQGQHVRVSMLNVALSFLWPEAMGASTLIGDDVRSGGSMAGVRYVYSTLDGHILLGFVSNDEFAAVCRAIDRPELLEDPRFSGVGQRFANARDLNPFIAERIAEKTTAEWLDRLRAEDAVFAPVNRPDTVHLDPQIVAIGALIEHDHPVAGRYRQPVHPVRFNGAVAPLTRHAPTLGQHTAEILAELARPTAEDGR
ncbi:CoA transferase [soil metagenome]